MIPALLAATAACTPADPPPSPDSPAHLDSAPLTHDSADDTEEPPASLPYTGSFTVEYGGDRCEGQADAVVIGSANVAGNASCSWGSGKRMDLTLSGRVHEDGSAGGDVASPDWLLSWQGAWSSARLTGDFQDPKTSPPLSGTFSLNAER